ncbi:hypothetical protein Tco_0289145 [Tanacetum coccineum]
MEEDLAMLFGDDDFNDADSEEFEDVIKELSTSMGNLEYGHRHLVKKVIHVSDAEVADGITIGEIGPRVSAVEGQIHVMVS